MLPKKAKIFICTSIANKAGKKLITSHCWSLVNDRQTTDAPFPDYEVENPGLPSQTVRITLSIAGQAVATRVVTSSTSTYYYLFTDHLGSTVLMGSQNSAKNQLEAVTGSRATYYPFGDYRGLPPTQTLTDRGFTGQKSNNQPAADLGLLYYNARYYAPGLARFISADTIVPDPANPQAFNRYAYTRNNPVYRTDPTGHQDQNPLAPQGCNPNLMSCVPRLPFSDYEISKACQKSSCLAGHLWIFYGIPYTEEQKISLIKNEAKHLCFQSGTCKEDSVGIMLGGLVAPLGGGIGTLSFVYDVTKSLAQQDDKGIVQEVGFEVGGNVTENILGDVAGNAVGAFDIGSDLMGLSTIHKDFIPPAQANVDRQINLAKALYITPSILSGPMSYQLHQFYLPTVSNSSSNSFSPSLVKLTGGY